MFGILKEKKNKKQNNRKRQANALKQDLTERVNSGHSLLKKKKKKEI